MASEFELIRRHFTRPTRHTDLAGGDDCALVRPRPGMQLAVSTDMLVAGTHFLPETDPESLGWKSLAVNLSDLAAMGAEPRWVVLAAALPAADETWVAAFARGFFACADAFDVDVIGGDTTRGPLNLTPTVFGEVPLGQALTRAGARAGDELWVSGRPGLAGLGLAHLRGAVLKREAVAPCLEALQRPQPRVALGLRLRGLASAAIDVSDGLLGDLGHVLERSGLGATVDEAALPGDARAATEDSTLAAACLLGGGDDYELLFCAPPAARAPLAALSRELGVPLTPIGMMDARPGLRLRRADGRLEDASPRGFDHFT